MSPSSTSRRAPAPVLRAHPRPPAAFTLSLPDALPISAARGAQERVADCGGVRLVEIHLGRGRDERLRGEMRLRRIEEDRKSTRLNSSHGYNSYAVFG